MRYFKLALLVGFMAVPLVFPPLVVAAGCVDGDHDGYSKYSSKCLSGTDCNDADPTVHPGAVDVCGDGIDNDCNKTVDDNCIFRIARMSALTPTNNYVYDVDLLPGGQLALAQGYNSGLLSDPTQPAWTAYQGAGSYSAVSHNSAGQILGVDVSALPAKLTVFNTDGSISKVVPLPTGIGPLGGERQWMESAETIVKRKTYYYLTDYANDSYVKFNPLDGTLVDYRTTTMRHPNRLAIDAAQYRYIVDWYRLHIFDSADNFKLSPISFSGMCDFNMTLGNAFGFAYIDGMAIDASNRVYLVDGGCRQIKVFKYNPAQNRLDFLYYLVNEDGTQLIDPNGMSPSGLAVSPDGRKLYVGGHLDMQVVVYDIAPF